MDVLESISRALKSLQFHQSEMKIYRILHERGEMTVKEIAEELQLSTRIVRMRLKRLLKEGFVRRRIVEKGWIGYAYTAEKPEEVIKKMKDKLHKVISNLEKLMEKNV